jgi:hypothetical protein
MSEAWLRRLEANLDAELVNGSPENPFRPAILRWASSHGRPVDPESLLASLEERELGGPAGSRRYRWNLPVASWIPLEERIRWRPAEAQEAERHPDEHGRRLWLPLILAEHVEWIDGLTQTGDPGIAARARDLLDEAMPTIEDDVARHALGADPWADTFMLWTFARRPRALTRVRGLVSAVASRYAARASRSSMIVLGRSFPFHQVPMPSATAHLAFAAARIGDGIEVVGPAVEWLRGQRRRDGGWGDPRQGSDLLTTLAVAELLGILDPAFEPAEVLTTMGRLVAAQEGKPALIGPEWSWMAGELLAFEVWSARPFRERFRWPHVPQHMIEERFHVPRYEAYLVDARLFEGIPGLADVPVEVAFLDLAGFGAWNSAHGQAAGDELLASLTALLRTVPESRTIRDGGDEFLVEGAPQADGLEDRMRTAAARWAETSLATWPDLPVVPLRIVVTTARADGLRTARERLGQWVGELKTAAPAPPPEGVVRRFDTGERAGSRSATSPAREPRRPAT